MILLDDKSVPPPPYPSSPPRHERDGGAPKFSTLPPHILLHIVDVTFPPDGLEAHRRNLYWLTISLRLVNRGLYIACMHTLRSTYVSAYQSLVKSTYTSDPFPESSGPASTSQTVSPPSSQFSIRSLQRETEVLDLFIALKAREDVWLDETDLYLEREESFNDLFALMQPRRRTEDLLRHYGVRYGIITPSDNPSSHSPKIPFSRLNISFSTRKIGLVLVTPASTTASRRTPYKRTTIIECTRERDEMLEVVAKKLAKELIRWVNAH